MWKGNRNHGLSTNPFRSDTDSVWVDFPLKLIKNQFYGLISHNESSLAMLRGIARPQQKSFIRFNGDQCFSMTEHEAMQKFSIFAQSKIAILGGLDLRDTQNFTYSPNVDFRRSKWW